MSSHAIAAPTAVGAFEDWWDRHGEWVEPPNLRRGGESGVKRVIDSSGVLYLKRQIGHTYRSVFFPFGRPTALRERAALRALPLIGVTVPQLVFSDARRVHGRWNALVVTRELAGYHDMTRWYAAGGRDRLGPEGHAELLRDAGRVLGRLHRHHWQHTCLYDKHIFLATDSSITGTARVALIDLEKCRRTVVAAMGARHDLRQLRRHSPMWTDADWSIMLEGHAETFGRRVL